MADQKIAQPPKPHKGAKSDLTAEELRRVIRYEPDTGHFFWVITLSKRAVSGKKCGWISVSNTKVDRWKRQYRIKIAINNQELMAHRLAWLYMTGAWPKCEIDHVDGDGTNNKWNNLREATTAQNQANRGTQKRNKSGYRGVFFLGKQKRYWAYINANGKRTTLGYFKKFEEAKKARVDAEKILHGEFSSHK